MPQELKFSSASKAIQYLSNITKKRILIANNEESNLFLEGEKKYFSQEGLNKIYKKIGTTNIEIIREKRNPQKYKKYYKLYKDSQAKEVRNSLKIQEMGIESFKVIGGKIVLIWKDRADGHSIISEKGFIETLRNPSLKNNSLINQIAFTLS